MDDKIKYMEERLSFLLKEQKRLETDLLKEETFNDTQRYTNLMSVNTSVTSHITQLQGLIESSKKMIKE